MSVKLLGFTAVAEVTDHAAFATAVRAELEAARYLLGETMVTLSTAHTKSELVFLRACVELRIPTIVFLTNDETAPASLDQESLRLREHLLGVTLAKYTVSQSPAAISILEWADALLCACGEAENEMLGDALALGIPTRKLHPQQLTASWTHTPEVSSPTRHGYSSRRELLEFLDKRFGH